MNKNYKFWLNECDFSYFTWRKKVQIPEIEKFLKIKITKVIYKIKKVKFRSLSVVSVHTGINSKKQKF